MRDLFEKNHTLRNEKGYTLIIVLMVLIVTSVLGLALMSTTANTMKISDNERIDQATYYIAEAGLVQRREQLNQIVKTAFDATKKEYLDLSTEIKTGEKQSEREKFDFEKEFLTKVQNKIPLSDTTFLNFEKNNNHEPKAIVTVSSENLSNKTLKYKITSKGIIASKNTRTLHQNFYVALNIDVDYTSKYAVHTKGSLSMNNGSIFGQVATAEEDQFKMHSGGSKICSKPTELVHPGPDADCLTYEVLNPVKYSNDEKDIARYEQSLLVKENLLEKLLVQNVPIHELPDFPDDKFSLKTDSQKPAYAEDKFLDPTHDHDGDIYPINKDQRFDKIRITNNEFTIDIGNSNRELYIDDTFSINSNLTIIGNGSLSIYTNGLSLEANGKITIQNGVKLSIYAKDKIHEVKGDILSTSNNTKQAKIYYQGQYPVNFSGASKLYGIIYAKQANMNLTAGSIIIGDILSGGSSVKLDGGANVVTNQYILAPNADIYMGAGFDIIGSVIGKTFNMNGGSKITHPSNNLIGETIINDPDIRNRLTSSENILEE
ncbi:hypothetical protein JFL43_00910 [Viridibacillus sp. YIM B01967]|uniref:Type 4 fimbrial biogenesis protein PilX N-terminal domain-containing protein n=1 Tax=Viridibacillus soli TaxID=2798301 RepID=A0ABS1H211_9BACL|nr:pilus assembly PilX N-terminal domain-containing protein [Viridibacillus soli]MBK3493450.1 hypothetical protein [Viridibacillus soli]